MAERKIGKKIIISDDNLKINGSFGSTKVIPRNEIKNIQAIGNAFWGVINIIMILGFLRGVRMLSGKQMVIIKRKYGADFGFWLHKRDVKELKEYV